MDPRERIPFRSPATVALSRITREIVFSCCSSQQWGGGGGCSSGSRRANAITTVGYTPRRDARVAHLRDADQVRTTQRQSHMRRDRGRNSPLEPPGATRYRVTVSRIGVASGEKTSKPSSIPRSTRPGSSRLSLNLTHAIFRQHSQTRNFPRTLRPDVAGSSSIKTHERLFQTRRAPGSGSILDVGYRFNQRAPHTALLSASGGHTRGEGERGRRRRRRMWNTFH